MALYVKKFGGSSVATPEKMLNIANRVLRDRKPGDKIVIVVSAMGDTTDDLLDLASQVSSVNHGREMDMLLATGEQMSIALMAMTFKKLGVPEHELAMMMTIALRFIPTLLDETDRIMKAQTSRGADFASGNIFQRMKNMLPLLVPLFISAFRRADELAVAMEARCYRGGEGRTRMHELVYAGRDYLAFALIIILAVGLAVLRWGNICVQ